MSDHGDAVDVIYIAASAQDARFTRICVASVRCFYPDVPIRLLVGGPLQRGLAEELRRYWDVGIADLPAGDYGWGFVKLEPLFGPPGERFLVLDSDTVITGRVLDHAVGRDEDLIVDNEDQTPERGREIYYDGVRAAQENILLPEPAFLFNTGQWFGRSGLMTREDFSGLITWGWPPRLVNPGVFKNGDQGVLNFVVNDQVRSGRIRVGRAPLMRWPGHGMHGLDPRDVAAGRAPPLVVHWAGMKKARQDEMVGAPLLNLFERLYYARLPGGEARRRLAAARHVLKAWLHALRMRSRLVVGKVAGQARTLDRRPPMVRQPDR